MKILKTIIIFVLLCIECTNVYGQQKPTYFDIIKSGQGKKSIIFIPGFASSAAVWDDTKEKFEKNYTCYTLTMAGFAGVAPQKDSSFENWETAIADFIKENNIHNPIIIGHSMGGALALALAADYPELIGKIVVVDALPCLAALSNPTFKTEDNPDCSAIVNQINSISDEQFYQMQKMSIQRLIADTTKHELVIDWSSKSDRKTFAEMYCDFSNTDLREKIKNIKCPTLILLEEYFKNVKPAIEEQYKNLKTANLQYSNKGLHFIMYDDEEWYFSQLENFIPTK